MNGSVIYIISDEDNEQMLVNPNSSLKDAIKLLKMEIIIFHLFINIIRIFLEKGFPLLIYNPKLLVMVKEFSI